MDASAQSAFKPARLLVSLICAGLGASLPSSAQAAIAQAPLFLGTAAPPLVMLTMGRDHKLYYEAYNDASDLNGDGVVDMHYDPAIDYFGYFDSHKCYSYTSGKFVPNSTTFDKKCLNAAAPWSGDFLNYLTTSRMDALRKVLYGGYRSTDTTAETVLERAYIPQDAHSWGKEYKSVAVDGYDIRDYTPLDLPADGSRHIFTNTTLVGGTDPLLRVLTNSIFRVWEWLSIERPVAGDQCAYGNNTRQNCVMSSTSGWQIVHGRYFSNLTNTTYNLSGYNGNPANKAAFDALVTSYATPAKRYGSKLVGTVNGSNNPNGSSTNYLSLIQGGFVVPPGEAGSYKFSVDGSHAVDLLIDGNYVAGRYGKNNSSCNCNTNFGTVTLDEGYHNLVFRQQWTGGSSSGGNYYLRWERVLPASARTDYTVRVQVCASGLLETECKGYKAANGTTVYKPIGLLHEYGEDDAMMFGLLTGSYAKNTSGGVLRKNVQSLTDEIDSGTGQFKTGMGGIIETINKLRIYGFALSNPGGYSHDQNCGVPEVSASLAEGRCRMWGNPTAEMMYEGLRYFAGKAAPTAAYSSGVNNSGTDDKNLGLPFPTWKDPYVANMGPKYPNGYPVCSKPSQLVISDIYPNYDTNQVPGGFFNAFAGDLADFNASTSADEIWQGETEATEVFIGQSGNLYDGAPTPKTVTSFKNIRGLAPEEPSREGGYYSASVASFGKTHDLNPVKDDQKTNTYSVALASPLPRIEIPVDGKIVTLVPFGKTVGGCIGATQAAQGKYQPTNTIVDLYVETIKNTGVSNQDPNVNEGRPYGKFRINYEDSEYGSDHDMDAIVAYTFAVQPDNSVVVSLNSSYAAGGCIQHMGYVISGTTHDGTYLDVRDSDTASDVDYFLDTPPGQLPGGTWSDGQALPLSASRTFEAGSASAAFIKHDPLWYAAKWGGFSDRKDPNTNVGNNKLDADEWDMNNDGAPDTYFLVTNAGQLKEQLTKAFHEIKKDLGSSSSIATNSTRLNTGTMIYQARFDSRDWSGHLLAFKVNEDGSIDDPTGGQLQNEDALWDAAEAIPSHNLRKIFTYDATLPGANKGTPFNWDSLNADQKAKLGSADLVNYLRGDTSKEKNNGPFRKRANLLGDIVNSDPWFSAAENYRYQILPEGKSKAYENFIESKSTRERVVYVGANDGMLHAFSAGKYNAGPTNPGFDLGSGQELFAYVPNSIIGPNLVSLADDPYEHKYFVDGPPWVGDAYIGGGWRTVLVGTTGAGGKGVFALDVTSPGAFGAQNVLWDISSTSGPDYADLGHTVSQASIARMANGDWAAIVANGYESANGKAVLYILDLKDGSVLRKFDTQAGPNNGLSTPIAVDHDNDRIVDYIYAGDLLGNLWKFDVRDSNSANWDFSYTQGGTPMPLFVACRDATNVNCSAANRQPITAKPQVGFGPQQDGLMVYFGTGKYFQEGDNIVGASPGVETFYAIWDTGTAPVSGTLRGGSGVLQEQTIDEEVSQGFYNLRITSNHSIDYTVQTPKRGWFMDLMEPPVPGPATVKGERVISFPLLLSGRILFVTLIPSPDPCDYGGTSWLMEMDALTGSRLQDSAPFDVSGPDGKPDGQIDNNDLVDDGGEKIPPSGKESTVGIVDTPGVVKGPKDIEKYLSGSSSEIEHVKDSSPPGSRGRQSWTQLR
jgi:type IV pilus assembly protein PilY1